MGIDNGTERDRHLAAVAQQRDDERQQAEAQAAQRLLKQMQDSAGNGEAGEDEAKAKKTEAEKEKAAAEEAKKRRAHEEAEARRKKEWEQRQREKEEAEQAAWENAVAMEDGAVMAAAVKRTGADTERITRRNMKQCVTEHIQTKCLGDAAFARQAMHPRKTMLHCFRYITRKAMEFARQEMEDNDEKPEGGGYGCDVPDDLCYLWAEQYFMDMDAKEDRGKEEKFVPKPYTGKSAPKPKKKDESRKTAPQAAPPGEKPDDGETHQMTLSEVGA